MSNELAIEYPTGSTVYFHLQNAVNQKWNGSAMVAALTANYQDYDIAASDVNLAGFYVANMPAVPAGVYSFVAKKQTGGLPATSDIVLGSGEIEWSGAAAVALAAVATAVADVPTVAEFEARSILAADYATATVAAAIKAKTDNLPSDPADQSAVEAAITAATSPLATAVAVADLPTNAELVAALADADNAVLAAIAALNNLSAAQVNAQVVDALATDSYALPGQGELPAAFTLAEAIRYLYKFVRNPRFATTTQFGVRADDGVTLDHKATLSYDSTTFAQGKMISGA